MFLTGEGGGQVSWSGGALAGLRAGAHILGTCTLQVNKQQEDALAARIARRHPQLFY